MKIIIRKNSSAIVKQVTLEKLPNFIVITGENGTGKTQFLAYLYSRNPNNISNYDPAILSYPMLINDPLAIDSKMNQELGDFEKFGNSQIKFIPNIIITDGENELNKVVYRDIETPTVDLGYNLNVSELITQGRTFVHKYIFYTMYKASIGETETQFLNNIEELNRRYLQEIENSSTHRISSNYENPVPELFTVEDKNLIERIMANHPNIDISLIQYYYIMYLPSPNSNAFSTNLGFLFIQYWARNRAGLDHIESPLEVFNQVAKEAGFRYTLQEPTINENETNVIIKLLDNETHKLIDINSISSGEKVILSLILAIYTSNTDAQFPEIILFDEPDAYLHPSMSRFMLDVLQNIFVKEKGIKVIMSTHSATTVALAPDDSLYKMDRELGYIVKTDKKEAITLLSQGIFTFEEGIHSFNLIKNSSKKAILCVEGKTDVLHIQTAMNKLQRHIDIEILDLHDAGSLASFIKSIPASILGGKKIIGLFDNDNEGRKQYQSIKGTDALDYKHLNSTQSDGKAYVCCLPPPSSSPTLNMNCTIEYLYSKEVLDNHNMLEKLNFSAYKDLHKSKSSNPEDDNLLNNEYTSGDSLRAYHVKSSGKVKFANAVINLNSPVFVGFNPLFDLLEKIIAE